MYQQDYILRIIAQIGVMLRRMRDSLREHHPEETLETATEAMGLVLDVDPRIAETLSPASLVALLGAGGQLDAVRALALGEVLVERTAALTALGQEQEAARSRDKASVLLRAVLDHEPTGERAAEARALLDRLGVAEDEA